MFGRFSILKKLFYILHFFYITFYNLKTFVWYIPESQSEHHGRIQIGVNISKVFRKKVVKAHESVKEFKEVLLCF